MLYCVLYCVVVCMLVVAWYIVYGACCMLYDVCCVVHVELLYQMRGALILYDACYLHYTMQ